MKKLLSVLVCLSLIFVFTGCGDNNKENVDNIDLEYYAKIGKIPELDYALGEDPQSIEDELSALAPIKEELPNEQEHNHEVTEFYFEKIEGEKNVLLDNGVAGYYYNKNNKKNGVSLIVNYDTSFGFEIGTVSVEIKNALKDYKFTEKDVNEDNAFFATYISNGTVLETFVNDVGFMFVFQENELFATAIYDKNNWTF